MPGDRWHDIFVGPVRHGRRPRSDRCAAVDHALAGRHDAACDHPNGVQQLARHHMVPTHTVAHCRHLRRRLPGCTRFVVGDQFRSEQAHGADLPGALSIRDLCDTRALCTEHREHAARSHLRLFVHVVDVADRSRRPHARLVFPRWADGQARNHCHQRRMPGFWARTEVDLFRRCLW